MSRLPRRCGKESRIARELERLQGTWLGLEIEENGREMLPPSAAMGKHATLTFRADQYICEAIMPSGRVRVYSRGVFQIDPTRRPKTIAFTVTKAGPAKGRTDLGIYRFRGGCLQICWSDAPTDQPPTSFVPRPGSQRVIFTYGRRGTTSPTPGCACP